MMVQVSIPGHYDHPLNGDWDWPAIPRQGESLHWGSDTFEVRHVVWQAHERGIDAYVVLRAMSVGAALEGGN